VTAHGANARSSIFYNRVKGEVERDIRALGLPCVFFARPSLLLGRPQDGRLAETWASAVLSPAVRWLPLTLRPISVEAVASGMVKIALEEATPSIVQSNAALHRLSVGA